MRWGFYPHSGFVRRRPSPASETSSTAYGGTSQLDQQSVAVGYIGHLYFFTCGEKCPCVSRIVTVAIQVQKHLLLARDMPITRVDVTLSFRQMTED
jgi:hypothetical protein